MEEKQRLWLRRGILALSGLICVGLCAAVGVPMVRLAREPELFRRWVAGFGIWGRLVYVAAVAAQVVLAVIPGEPLELAGGYAFGALEGTVLALVGIVLGSAAVFGLVRRFGRGLVAVLYSEERMDSLAFLRDTRRSRALAFLLMTIPGTPKDLLSYFAGLTQLRLREWLTIVAVARIPSVIGSTCSGGAAGSGQYGLAAAVLVLTALFSGAGLLYYRRVCREESGTK